MKEKSEQGFEETVRRAAVEEPFPPFGLLAAILFVRSIIVVTACVTAVVCLFALMRLIEAPFSEDLSPVLVRSVASVASFVFLLVMLAGASWVDAKLSGRRFVWLGKGGNPTRQIVLPVVVAVAIYGALAVFSWLALSGSIGMAQTWQWPVIWGFTGTAAFFLYRYLDKSLPVNSSNP
ncbi:MAG TPA: hypothetical protein VGE67_14305 [Haloferula sp.]